MNQHLQASLDRGNLFVEAARYEVSEIVDGDVGYCAVCCFDNSPYTKCYPLVIDMRCYADHFSSRCGDPAWLLRVIARPDRRPRRDGDHLLSVHMRDAIGRWQYLDPDRPSDAIIIAAVAANMVPLYVFVPEEEEDVLSPAVASAYADCPATGARSDAFGADGASEPDGRREFHPA
jgi:hypothetical protein